jgi:N-acetylmuramoyl-L-alanine amidase
LRRGQTGDAVRDLQHRLTTAGFAADADEAGVFCDATWKAVLAFQQAHGLEEDGVCGDRTWAALVEASWELGDRLLHLRVPHLRGDDVAELQRRLGRLGFDAGRIDGIFGADTAGALQDFQRNMGLPPDGICGYETVHVLQRVSGRSVGPSIAAVREEERLRHASPTLARKRLVVGDLGGFPALTRAVARRLRTSGAIVLQLDDPDGSVQAAAANRFAADLYLGLRASESVGFFAYYAVAGFESYGGRRLAELLHDRMSRALPMAGEAEGRRVGVLRETRMPAVLCELGPTRVVLDHAPTVAAAIRESIESWVAAPLERA